MSEKGGMEKSKFLTQFKSQEGSDFPFKKMGYESAYELLKEMSSVVHIQRTNGKMYLVPVVTEDVKHIAKLKQGEKDNKHTKNKPKFHAVFQSGGGGSSGGNNNNNGNANNNNISNSLASAVESSCNYNSFSTFGPGVTKGGAYVQYELPPRFAKKSAEYHNNKNYNNNSNMNNYNYSSSANSSSNIKKTPPPSSTDRKSSSTTPPPPSAPTTCVYESGVIPREDVLKLVTLLEEETGGLNTSTFASSYRKRYKGEELDFG